LDLDVDENGSTTDDSGSSYDNCLTGLSIEF